MESGNKLRFRLMHWPGVPVPVPPVSVLPVTMDSEGFLDFERVFASAVPPDELYLRQLGDLDLSDWGAVAEFTRTYGRLGKHRWLELPTYLRGRWRPVQPLRELDELRRARRLVNPSRPTVTIHVREVIVHAQIVRDLVRLYDGFQVGRPLSEVLADWESIVPRPEARSVGDPVSMQDLADTLTLVLNPALRDFHVRIEFEDQSGAGSSWGEPFVSLYAAACLQLANHIAESAEYRRCKAEGCGRLFVRQQGRAKHDQHRVRGVLSFCSDTCANRQSQRDHRRRKAAAKRQAGDTASPDTPTKGSTP
jgi:hypothetical protein